MTPGRRTVNAYWEIVMTNEVENVRAMRTWEEFQAAIAIFQTESNTYLYRLLYRGHADSSWKLHTTLERAHMMRVSMGQYYGLMRRIKPALESLTDRSWPMTYPPEITRVLTEYGAGMDSFGSGETMAYELMTHLRHHGFPSPLLDWTRSVYVASFFAFAGARPISACDANKPERRVAVNVLAVLKHDPNVYGDEIPRIIPVGQYLKTHKRHVQQQSEYTMCVCHNGVWRYEPHTTVWNNDASGQRGMLYKYTIPVSERAKVLSYLDQFNVNAFSLYGSEESLMETLAFRNGVGDPLSDWDV